MSSLAEVNKKLSEQVDETKEVNTGLRQLVDLYAKQMAAEKARADDLFAQQIKEQRKQESAGRNKPSQSRGIGGSFAAGLVGDNALNMADKLLAGAFGVAGGLAASLAGQAGRGLKFGIAAVALNTLAQKLMDQAFEADLFANMDPSDKKLIKDGVSNGVNAGLAARFLGFKGPASIGIGIAAALQDPITQALTNYFDPDGDKKFTIDLPAIPEINVDLNKPEHALAAEALVFAVAAIAISLVTKSVFWGAGLIATGVTGYIGSKIFGSKIDAEVKKKLTDADIDKMINDEIDKKIKAGELRKPPADPRLDIPKGQLPASRYTGRNPFAGLTFADEFTDVPKYYTGRNPFANIMYDDFDIKGKNPYYGLRFADEFGERFFGKNTYAGLTGFANNLYDPKGRIGDPFANMNKPPVTKDNVIRFPKGYGPDNPLANMNKPVVKINNVIPFPRATNPFDQMNKYSAPAQSFKPPNIANSNVRPMNRATRAMALLKLAMQGLVPIGVVLDLYYAMTDEEKKSFGASFTTRYTQGLVEGPAGLLDLVVSGMNYIDEKTFGKSFIPQTNFQGTVRQYNIESVLRDLEYSKYANDQGGIYGYLFGGQYRRMLNYQPPEEKFTSEGRNKPSRQTTAQDLIVRKRINEIKEAYDEAVSKGQGPAGYGFYNQQVTGDTNISNSVTNVEVAPSSPTSTKRKAMSFALSSRVQF